MPLSPDQVREAATAIGLKLAEERLPAIAIAIETSLNQIEVIRPESTSVPIPTAFDAAWSPKK